MKTNKIIFFVGAIVIVTVLFFFYLGVFDNSDTSEINSYLIDVTDRKHIDIPDPNEIFNEQFLEEGELFKEIRIRVGTVNSLKFSPIKEFHLEEQNPLLGNVLLRKAELKRIKEDIGVHLESIADTTKEEYGYSLIFKVVIAELTFLSKSNHATKTLDVYSNLREHSSDNGINLYYKPTVLLLESNPEKLKEALLNDIILPPLEDITIGLHFTGSKYEEVEIFERMASLYKEILEEQGAQVHISSAYQKGGNDVRE